MKLPEWEEARDKCDAGTATALERFIYHNEPADVGPGFQYAADFRSELLELIEEVRASAQRTEQP